MRTVIAISGKMGSGKSTLADALCHHFALNNQPTVRLKFAGPIYEACAALQTNLNIPVEKDRKLLQFIGAHYRDTISNTFWVDQLEAKIHAIPEDVIIIIDDLRFEEEAALITKVKGLSVRLECAEEERAARVGSSLFLNTKHPSETSLDTYPKFDLILNSTTLTPGAAAKVVAFNAFNRKPKNA